MIRSKKDVFTIAYERLKTYADVYDSVLVGYSGGKDSSVVLDMCVKTFKRVVAFYMYIIPDTSIMNERIKYAEDRYKIKVLQYPHWALAGYLKEGVYCNPSHVFDNLPTLEPNDLYAIIREDTGIDLIALGQRKTDTMYRKRRLSSESWMVINPIADWTKFDVLAYLKINNIPIPDSSGGQVSGIGISEKNLLWLYDNYPEDFKKVLRIFPYAEVPIYWRKFYGQEKKREDSRNAKKSESKV